MLLVIDIGNSSITASLASNGILGPARRTPTRPALEAGAFEAALDALLAEDGASLALVEGIVLSSVVPRLESAVAALATARGVPLLVASHATVPIPILVEDPATVGADRLVDAYAAARLHRVPAIVIDFGTATTIEGVGGDGAYLGGAIAPGLEIGLDALAERTALLPRVPLRAPTRVLATTTVEAIQAGTVLGHRELAAGLLRIAREELAERTGVPARRILAIATGGVAAAPWVGSIAGLDVVDPELTLKGLVELWLEVGPARAGGGRTRAGGAARAASAGGPG